MARKFDDLDYEFRLWSHRGLRAYDVFAACADGRAKYALISEDSKEFEFEVDPEKVNYHRQQLENVSGSIRNMSLGYERPPSSWIVDTPAHTHDAEGHGKRPEGFWEAFGYLNRNLEKMLEEQGKEPDVVLNRTSILEDLRRFLSRPII